MNHKNHVSYLLMYNYFVGVMVKLVQIHFSKGGQ